MRYEELEPASVFSYFKQLSDIPRGSGNEREAGLFILNTARSFGHEAELDAAGNVFVRAAATPGYESKDPVMLQGHMDMVCEANRGVDHNFLRDPIELILNGDELRANGTTLGADDGVAVAMMLALLASDLPHPELECLFTTEEETGMGGMNGFDPAKVKARKLINLDSEGEGVATVSCAGGIRSNVILPIETEDLPSGWSCLKLEIGGLAGGHSGGDIHLGRTNAIVLMARLLFGARRECGIRLCRVAGGNRDNAIPRECEAVIASPDPDGTRSYIDAMRNVFRNEMVPEDHGFSLTVSCTAGEPVLTEDRSAALLAVLCNLPSGVAGMSRTVPGLVETSSNLAVVRQKESACEIVVSSRSSVESRLDEMTARVDAATLLTGAAVIHRGRYPGWAFLEGSPLQKLYLDTYRSLFGKEAAIIGIHAGLECGVLKGKIQDMDIISIGPDIRNLHSPDEVLYASSLTRCWALVTEMLKNI